MPIRLYNSLTKTKEDFAPLDPANVRMYVCGPTVYDFAHIGNARPAIVFDVLYRLLRHEYGETHVTYARNFTDVDDKINARALEMAQAKGVSIEAARAELTATTERQYLEDVRALGCLDPNEMPRATEHIAGVIAMIADLVREGFAYEAQGHVLFDVSKKSDYGKLARRSLDDMIAGARVDVAPYKKGPMDFVLWKPSDADTPGWDSPWGRGRPGWHIECSAMIADRLGPGDTIDIHGGGIDLVFPHHENEIAQSEGAHHGHPLAKVWMHNGFLQVEGEKMSKSVGNFVTIRQALGEEKGDVLRFNMLKTHYRQPIDWTSQGRTESFNTLTSWYGSFQFPKNGELSGEVLEALKDDLNTPKAIAALHALHRERDFEALGANLRALGFTGMAERQPRAGNMVSAEYVEARIEQRNVARAARNWAESDRIRDELLAKGIVLKDGPNGTTWEVKR
ncbi:MAG TPA: cysteine--tRNA ligase [Rhizomicrobium sp.]|nr:cysteine--tRNA ligase [Rhizomicrobium sp.]